MPSSNLFRSFGIGADVSGQTYADKALRRKSTGTTRGFDIASGELVQGETTNGDVNIPHNLRRQPEGGFILLWETSASGEVFVSAATPTEITVRATAAGTVKVWVV